MILGRYCNVKLDASNCRKQAKKNSGFDRIQLYASQTLVGPCYRLSEKATFGGRALFRGDFYGHKKKSSWSTSVAPTRACILTSTSGKYDMCFVKKGLIAVFVLAYFADQDC